MLLIVNYFSVIVSMDFWLALASISRRSFYVHYPLQLIYTHYVKYVCLHPVRYASLAMSLYVSSEIGMNDNVTDLRCIANSHYLQDAFALRGFNRNVRKQHFHYISFQAQILKTALKIAAVFPMVFLGFRPLLGTVNKIIRASFCFSQFLKKKKIANKNVNSFPIL